MFETTAEERAACAELVSELVRLRVESGMSQRQLAEEMGVAQATVSALEAGLRDPRLSTLRRYARAVGARWVIEVILLEDESRCTHCGSVLPHKGTSWKETTACVHNETPPVVQEKSPMGRIPSCVERWPECYPGDYNPACCRFPKSCSCEVYPKPCSCGNPLVEDVDHRADGPCTLTGGL